MEIKRENQKKYARLWYEDRGINVRDEGEDTLLIQVQEYWVEISDLEQCYRAELWMEENDLLS